MEKELKEVIKNLTYVIENEAEKEYGLIWNNLANQLLKSPYHLSEPENYYTMFQFELNSIIEKAVEKLHKEKDSEIMDCHKPQFIFLHYNFLSSNIEKLLKRKTNTFCYSADVSRYLIKMYLEYSLTGFIPDTVEEEHYWLPKFGNNKDWMNFCDGLYKLYYGNNELYLDSLKALMEAQIRTYEHIEHKYFMILKNGNEFLFDTTYDDRGNHLKEKNECYLVPNYKIKFKNKFKTIKENIIEYACVPKSEVKEIRIVDQKVIL